MRQIPPQIPLGELTALPRLLVGFKGPTSKGREGRRKMKGEKVVEKEGRREGKGREEEFVYS